MTMPSVPAVAGSLIGVLLLTWLLALEVFVVAIALLAYLVSRDKITAVVLTKAGAGLAVSVVGYIAVAVLLGALLS
jgi:hypothetical protein